MKKDQVKKRNTVKGFFMKKYPYFCACGLVLALYLSMLAVNGIFPFGESSIAAYDLSAQICPFIEHLFDVFKGRSALFHSHAIGGGADMFGSLAYFFISPFSPLFLIFGEGRVAEAAAFVLGAKLVTLAFVGVWFASVIFRLHRLVCAGMGVLYAYCGYMFVANTYINWLDLLAYMPFLVWAFRRFVQTERFWAFSLLMAACVYTSFSIACFAMLTVYPALVCYAFFCVKKEERMRFITRLSFAFVCAILLALPILIPCLLAYLRAGRGGSFFGELFFGFSKDGFQTGEYMGFWAGTLNAKLSYILADAVFVTLTFVYFVRSKLKTPLSKFMLVAGGLTLLPAVVDECMQLLNMGSYLSYALRFGFLNAIYFFGGACLGLQGLDLFKKEKKRGACLRQKPTATIVYCVFGVGVLLAMALFFLGEHHLKLARFFSDEDYAATVRMFAAYFARSLGGILTIGIFSVGVALVLGAGCVLVAAKKLPIRILSIFGAAIVLLQGVFFNMTLVDGNYSTQNIAWQRYHDLAQTLQEEDGDLYRVRDYNNEFSSNIAFEGDTYTFTAFSSMLDRDNFPATLLFGYSGNGKNISRGNGGTIFGDCMLGYKYLMVPQSRKEKVESYSWYQPVTVEKNGAREHLSKDGLFVYENVYAFPLAYTVDSAEYRFVAENVEYEDRMKNQIALYHYLGGEQQLQEISGKAIYELTEKLWAHSGEVALSKNGISVDITAREGQYLMVSFIAIEGYQVRVNGEKVQLCGNDLNFLCVPLQAGENHVEFVYESPYTYYALWGVIVGGIGFCFIAIFLRRTKIFEKSEKVIGWAGISLSILVATVFFILPIAVFLVKCGAMLMGLF